jgi:hypothetical protein
MIDALRLAAGWGLAWLFGIALVGISTPASRLRRLAGGEAAWTIGCGFFVGAFGVTVWMRALSLVGLRFSVLAIGLPVAIATLALAAYLRRSVRAPAIGTVSTGYATMTRAERVLWTALAA